MGEGGREAEKERERIERERLAEMIEKGRFG